MKNKILFNSKAHSYTNTDKIQYISVSTLIGKYKRPFNTKYWSTYKAYQKVLGDEQFKTLKKEARCRLEDDKLFDTLKHHVDKSELLNAITEILYEWQDKKDASIIKGNDYHTFHENLAKSTGVSINPYSGEHFRTIESTFITTKGDTEYREPAFDTLRELPDGFHPELILWNNNYKLAGQADKVYIETIDDIRYVDIDDLKTNKKIDTTNFFGNMKDPLSHLPCCNYNHYRLQISTYAWLLEQEGYTVRSTRFSHLNKPYVFDYMKDEVEIMIGVNKFDNI